LLACLLVRLIITMWIIKYRSSSCDIGSMNLLSIREVVVTYWRHLKELLEACEWFWIRSLWIWNAVCL